MKPLWIITMLWLPVNSKQDFAFVTIYNQTFKDEDSCYAVAEKLKRRTPRFTLRAVCQNIGDNW